jgi:hypothetical protein
MVGRQIRCDQQRVAHANQREVDRLNGSFSLLGEEADEANYGSFRGTRCLPIAAPDLSPRKEAHDQREPNKAANVMYRPYRSPFQHADIPPRRSRYGSGHHSTDEARSITVKVRQ